MIRLLKCKDYRMSLNFILPLMDSLIINQIKAFCDTNDRDACSQEVGQAIEKLKTLDCKTLAVHFLNLLKNLERKVKISSF